MAQGRSGSQRRGRTSGPAHTQFGSAGAGGLVGAGPSLVGTIGAMRARDISRPSKDDAARAERTVVLRRRPTEPAAVPAAHAVSDTNAGDGVPPGA